jgi:acetyl esterase/lipase
MLEKRIVLSVPGMTQIVRRQNLIYKAAGNDALKADLYMPTTTDRLPPVVIFIHGALPPGVPGKDAGVFVSWGELAAASGMAAVAFNHRLRWVDSFVPESLPQAAQDLSNLVGFVRANASHLQIDGERVCLFAFSAGGPLLAAPIRERWAGVRCMVGFYTYLADPLPGSKDADRFAPIAALKESEKAPPTLIAKAGKDLPLVNYSIDLFANAARDIGSAVRLEEHPEGLHGFDILNDDDTSRRIIRDAIEFMRSHLL